MIRQAAARTLHAGRDTRMKWFFDADNPVMRTLSMLADTVVLNLLTLVCSLPLFTAGAALTALHDACIRLVRLEDGELVRDYFRTFRSRFRTGTAAGLLFLGCAALLYLDYLAASAFVPLMRPAVLALGLILLALSFYVFALLARRGEGLGKTLRLAAKLAVGFFPRTLVLVLFTVILWLACFQWFRFGSLILLLTGLSLPVYVCAVLMDGVFEKIEK